MHHSSQLQWISEVPNATKPLPKPHVYQDDEDSVLQVTTFVRGKSVNPQNIHKPPFTDLSEQLLRAIRDDALEYGSFADRENPQLDQELQAACVVRLNQLTPTAAQYGTDVICDRSRDFILLSLISPQIVLNVVCQWASRQTVHARVVAACQVVTALGNIPAYSEKRPNMLVSWLANAFFQCTDSTSAEFSRLLMFLVQLLASPHVKGCPPITVSTCFEHIVNPLLERGSAESAGSVINGCIQASRNTDALLRFDRDTILCTFELIASCASFENRMAGKLDQVEGAIDTMLALYEILPTKLKTEVRFVLKRLLPWFNEGRFGQKAHAAVTSKLQGSNFSINDDFTRRNSTLLQLEQHILTAANIDALRENEELNHDNARLLPAAERRALWLAALVRHMPLLTATELKTLFEVVLSGNLSAYLHEGDCTCRLHGYRGGSWSWCCFTEFTKLGVRVLMMLLNSEELRESVSLDPTLCSQIARRFCSAIRGIVVQRQGTAGPSDLCTIVFSELFTIVAVSGSNPMSYIISHPEVTDVLMMTLLELSRKALERDAAILDLNSQNERSAASRMASVLHKHCHRNQLTAKITEAVLKILDNCDSPLTNEQGSTAQNSAPK